MVSSDVSCGVDAMTLVGTAHQCQACQALVNPSWTHCLVCRNPAPDWVTRWKELATITAGLEPDDSRLNPVLASLAVCDRAYREGNRDGFLRAARRVQRLMLFTGGASITWEGRIAQRVGLVGPSIIEHVQCASCTLWAFVTVNDQGRWVSDRIIVLIEGTTT